jgi:hypothetical protein
MSVRAASWVTSWLVACERYVYSLAGVLHCVVE